MLYPLKFDPILKDKIWGGSKLADLLQKPGGDRLGESWEISGVPGNVSRVSNGSLKGQSLQKLLQTYTGELMGTRVYKEFGPTFPLLFKFIDASADLSVQLHPDDILARKRHDSFGKTEMWYIIQADPGSRLILGFNRKMDETTYLDSLKAGKLTEVLNEETVSSGDAYFIAPGTVHAIGSGILLAEIQQTSDITYRIYDWDRPGLDGKMRELHTEEALQAIDYGPAKAKLDYLPEENKLVPICNHSFFHTSRLSLSNAFDRELVEIDSFVVYMCISGQADILDEGHSTSIGIGETVLIPGNCNRLTFQTTHCELLEVYIPQKL